MEYASREAAPRRSDLVQAAARHMEAWGGGIAVHMPHSTLDVPSRGNPLASGQPNRADGCVAGEEGRTPEWPRPPRNQRRHDA